MQKLTGKVIFITGASRGIGREMALRFAKDGAKIAIAAKTTEPHPKLPGTIHSVADEVAQAGGQALPLVMDVCDVDAVQRAVAATIEHFGQIDVLINNASAIYIANTENTPLKRFDLMMDVNVRGTFACTQACIPHLKKSTNPHILTLSPPLNLDKKWFKDHVAYTISKYGMSMCTIGMAAELKHDGIAVNSLWPKTTIATMAIKMLFPEEILHASRYPSIVADAAYYIVTSDSKKNSGNFYIDEEILQTHGITDFSSYALDPTKPLYPDLFL